MYVTLVPRLHRCYVARLSRIRCSQLQQTPGLFVFALRRGDIQQFVTDHLLTAQQLSFRIRSRRLKVGRISSQIVRLLLSFSFLNLSNMTPLYSVSLLFGFVSLSVVLAQGTSGFDWNSIEPSTNFTWVDCFSGFQCARFKAPLDYSNPDNGQSAAIAVVKLAAQAPASEYGGPIFTNPGGPGDSGIDFILASGQFIQSVIGTQFDIIGFDPRGVHNSTPRVSFFNTDVERLTFLLDEREDLNSTSDALSEFWARYQVAGQLAQSRDNGTLNFVTTADVARDMLGMSEALGQENLQYWGFSYGTFLGSVFATMFPDRIKRLVIDGVLDMDAWLANDLGGMVSDTDKTIQWFFDGCHAAGPKNCAFYASSPAKIEAALDDIYDSLRSQPIPVFLNSDLYGIFTYDNLRSLIMEALYVPPLFPLLAQGLAQVQAGSATLLFELLSIVSVADNISPEALVAIECGDSDPFNADASQLREYMSRINSTFAGMGGMPLMHRCAGWKIHPQHRFKGPVGAANTSHPLLVIGNTADPITPLAGAKKTSLSFPGSVLLTQDSPGHGSINTNSTCTHQHVAAYFVNGTLPEEGVVCSLDAPLFPTSASESPRSFKELRKRIVMPPF
ncbi:hypothetical protein D9758_006133 [Tetrapyrgos nigripes]|uniref:Alpha/beta-hydrolase n=1 Tax=Tetrapyrgos nigripes TaxID=182062 RepID=A0A8H5LLC6_9AGAR|nr:hypothetical protein D9758_006133 [Tetrapyrgos nigripes]